MALHFDCANNIEDYMLFKETQSVDDSKGLQSTWRDSGDDLQ